MGRRAVGDPFDAAVPREAEHRASGGLEDPRQRPTAATMDPGGTRMTLPSLRARQKPPLASRQSRLRTSVTLAERAAITAALAKVSQT